MYKPANIREFVTPALHKKPVSETIDGRTQKRFESAPNPNIRGKFKMKGTSEVTANGIVVVNDKTTFTTWWKADLESGDVLTIGGQDYRVIGIPENVEMRGRYAIINLERIGGGA